MILYEGWYVRRMYVTLKVWRDLSVVSKETEVSLIGQFFGISWTLLSSFKGDIIIEVPPLSGKNLLPSTPLPLY